MRRIALVFLLTAVSLICIKSALAGVYFESEIHSNIDSDVQRSQTFISGTKMKNLINETYGWIVDLKKGKIFNFDLNDGTYYETSLDQMSEEFDALGAKVKIFSQLFVGRAEDEQIAKALKDHPEELDTFGDSKPPLGKEDDTQFQPVLKKIKKKKKVLNYECSLVRIDMGPNETQEFWITSQIPSAQEVLNFWKAYYRFSSDSLTKFTPLKNQFQAMALLDGFVLSRKTHIRSGQDTSFEEEENVVVVQDQQFSDDVFELPKDMTRIDGSMKNLLDMKFQRKDS